MSKQPPRPYFGTDWTGKCITSSYMSVERVEKEIMKRWGDPEGWGHRPGTYKVIDVKRNVYKTIEIERKKSADESLR